MFLTGRRLYGLLVASLFRTVPSWLHTTYHVKITSLHLPSNFILQHLRDTSTGSARGRLGYINLYPNTFWLYFQTQAAIEPYV